MSNEIVSTKAEQIATRWLKLSGLIEAVAQCQYAQTLRWQREQFPVVIDWDDLDPASQDGWRQLACVAVDAIAQYKTSTSRI